MNNELLQSYLTAIPGFELVAHKEVAIPYYHYNCQFLFSEKRALSIVQEYVLEFIDMGLSLEEISAVLGLNVELVSDAYFHLIQLDLLQYDLNQVTEMGREYLENHRIDKLENGEYEILVNTFTGAIDTKITSSMQQNDAKQYYCYRAHIKTVTPESLDFNQMRKVLRTYCERNELDTNSKLIDIVNLTKKSTRYRKLDVLIYQNGLLENRIIAIESGKKNEKYEEIFYSLDATGVDLLQTSVDGFFEDDKVSEIYNIFKNRDIASCNDFLDVLTLLDNPVVVLPLVECSYFNDYLLRIIREKISESQKIIVFICGEKYKSVYQENIVKELLALQKSKKLLKCIHIASYLPLLCFSNDTGYVQIVSREKLNLKSTKDGLISYAYMLSHEEIQQIVRIAPILTLKESPDKQDMPLMPDMKLLEKLWLDFDSKFTTKFGFSIFPDGVLKDRSSFISMAVATDKLKYNEFLNIVNKTIFESLKMSAKREISDKNFFWGAFLREYPKLHVVLDKIRVYRNNIDHIQLDTKNEKLYYTYLKQDIEGLFVEFIPNGYKYMQALLLSSMEASLREA